MSDSTPTSSQLSQDPTTPKLQSNESINDNIKEEEKEQQVSYESLVAKLKEQNKKIKDYEKLKSKFEERFKSQTKTIKENVKERKIIEEFLQHLFPIQKLALCSDQEKKYHNAEILKKTWNEIQKSNKDILEAFKEENQNLKAKIIELSQELKKPVPSQKSNDLKIQELERNFKNIEQKLIEKDQEIENLRLIEQEYNQNKGIQLLQAFKISKNDNSQGQTNKDYEEIQQLKQQLSEKTNRILEIQEKLQLANETIQAIENQESQHSKSVTPKNGNLEGQLNNQSNDIMLNAFDDQEIQQLQDKLLESEQERVELLNKLEKDKEKARILLLKQEINQQKLKMIVAKLENFLRNQQKLSQEEINKIVQFKEDEILNLQKLEKDLIINQNIQQQLNQHNENFHIKNQDRTQHDQQREDTSSMINIEYIRNVFVKYLEYLAINNSKEIKTIENVLFTELKVTKDQAQRIDHHRRQNNFWKKFLLVSTQPVVKGKFSAGLFKKKLFGGGNNTQQNQIYGGFTDRQSIGGAPFDIMNRTITSSINGTLNNTIVEEIEQQNQRSILQSNNFEGHQRILSDGEQDLQNNGKKQNNKIFKDLE